MDKQRAYELLGILSQTPATHQPRAGWVTTKCPLAPWDHDNGIDNNPSFGLNYDEADPFCFCFSCGGHGNASEWLVEIDARNRVSNHRKYDFARAMELIQESIDEAPLFEGIGSYEDAFMAEEGNEPTEYPNWWIDSFPHAIHVPWARKYLKERNVTPLMAMALDIRVDTKQKRICFPIRDFEGTTRGFHGRAVLPDTEPRYRMYQFSGSTNPIIWYGENWLDFNKPILVVEGPFDVASCMRVYRNVVSPLFANPSGEKLERLSGVMEWVTFLDSGKGGDSGRKKINKIMTGTVLKHLQPLEGEDAGSMSEKQLRELLSPHLKLQENPFDK